ncbi:hypothetical protein [Novipirellula rosea]|uniref:Secreted protein n=1 Tax=Novipirellula rosea TaxID=1031540 RepID=A0ABP8NTU5_9BACT
MKFLLSTLLLSSVFAVVGCDSGSSSSVVVDKDAQAIADYEAAQAQSQKEIEEAEKAAKKPAN